MWYWWVIGIVAVCAAIGVVLWLIFGRKKSEVQYVPQPTHKQLIEKSRARLKTMDRLLDVLLTLPHNEALRPGLQAIRDKVRYLSPSASKEVRAIDEAITEQLNALRTAPTEGADLGAIETLISERGIYTA